jgi:uncharacterized protein YjbI with pentapeptide repeats
MMDDDVVWHPYVILERYANGERDFRGLQIDDTPRLWPELTDARTFKGAILDDADFSTALICADFTGASLRRCNFVKAHVKTCVFKEADLEGGNFSNAAIDSAVFDGAKLLGCKFDGAGAYGYTYKAGELPQR